MTADESPAEAGSTADAAPAVEAAPAADGAPAAEAAAAAEAAPAADAAPVATKNIVETRAETPVVRVVRERRVVPGPDGRSADLGLARVHLRLGSYALARAELETLAGRDALDDDGLVDLAEVRWRTGDLIGAGEAANAATPDGRGPLVALVIAAESAAARGRSTEARALAQRAIDAADGSIDATFAGMPRASVWPADPAAPPPSPTTMFHAASEPLSSGRAVPIAADVATPADTGALAAATAVASAAAGTPGFWDLGDTGRDDAADTLDADTQLAEARSALRDGDATEAGHRFALVLRLSPALAPAVLDEIADRPERSLALVRGDAYRLVGRETDARRAYADAAGATASTPTPMPSDPENVTTDPSAGDPT